MKLWNTATGKLVSTLGNIRDIDLFKVAFSDNGLLATGSVDGIINFWNTDTATLSATITVPDVDSLVASLAFNDDGLLATSSVDGSINFWNTDSKTLNNTLQDSNWFVTIAFDKKGLLAAGSLDIIVKFWISTTGELKVSFVNSTPFGRY